VVRACDSKQKVEHLNRRTVERLEVKRKEVRGHREEYGGFEKLTVGYANDRMV